MSINNDDDDNNNKNKGYYYYQQGKILVDVDKLSNAKRMKIALRETRTHRILNSPDIFSMAMIEDFINQMRKIWGFSEEEMRYAVKVVYSKRVKRHEHRAIQLGIKN